MHRNKIVFGMILTGSLLYAQTMPSSIAGAWRIGKILPTANTQCWDKARAQTLVGSTLTYKPHVLGWKGGDIPVTDALTRTLSAHKFLDEYKVDLATLGIHAASVTEVDLQHEDADITGATTEVPGDTVLVAGPGRIIVSACGVFYTATRVAGAR